MKKVKILFGILGIVLLSACNKLIDVKPENELDVRSIYANDHLATSAITGIYKSMMTEIGPYNGQLTRGFMLSTDEVIRFNSIADDTRFLNLSWKSTDVIIANFWNKSYSYIYHCNSAIINLQKSKSLSANLRDQLEGEAKFLRAFVYFYLVNLFDSIPLVLDIDTETTIKLKRTAPSLIYQQIITDLAEAQQLLPESYPVNSISQNIRATKAAATALLAKVFLYTKKYNSADELSSKVIRWGKYTLENNLAAAFLSGSKETIFALYPTMDEYNTVEGRIFSINPTTNKASFEISPGLLAAFEPTDYRVAQWMNSYAGGTSTFKVPCKYKVSQATDGKVTEYNTILRLAEMYLIRAEANLKLGNLQQAVDDINAIRKRANATILSSTDPQKIRIALELENQREFFAEFGHRWFDLRRWESVQSNWQTRADDILGQSKKQYWAGYKINLPIPADELLRSDSLTQNVGY
jgi:hypothetical protein